MKAGQVAALLAVAAGAGFFAGRLLRPGEAAPPAPPPAPPRDSRAEEAGLRARIAELEAALERAREAPVAAASGTPAATAPASSSGMTEKDFNRILQSQHDAVQEHLQSKDRTIAELKAEVDRLKATLPEPQVLRDLRSGDVQQMISLAGAIRQEVQARLLTPPEHLKADYAEFLRRPNAGTARILPRGKFVHVIDKREGGAYWSFATRDNDYDKEPDLELQQGNFSSGFYGSSKGWLLDLGETPLEEVGTAVQSPPPGLQESQREQWAFLWSDSAFLGASTKSEGTEAYRAFQDRAWKLKFPDRVPAVAGHIYVLRSVLPGEHDILVVFKAVDADDTGMSLVWQILKDWEIPRRR